MAKGPKIIFLVFEKFICMLFKSVHCCNCLEGGLHSTYNRATLCFDKRKKLKSLQRHVRSTIHIIITQLKLQKKKEKTLGETQTQRDGCSKAEPKTFAAPQTPFPGAQDGQYLISWRWSLYTHRPSLVEIDARNFELSW